MKKLLAMLLAVTTVFSASSMTALADNSDELTKDKTSTEIISTMETPGSNPWMDVNWNDWNTVVCVNVKWSDTTFTYSFGDEWNAQKHKYVHSDDATKEDGWNRNFITIDVENLSNCPVLVEIADVNTLNDDVKIKFDKNRKAKNLTSALRPKNVEDKKNQYQFIMNFDYTPKEYVENYNDLITFKVKISEGLGTDECDHDFVPSDLSCRYSPDFVDNGYLNYVGDSEAYHSYYHECMYCGAIEKHSIDYSNHKEVEYTYEYGGRTYTNYKYYYFCEGCNEYIPHESCVDIDDDYFCDICGIDRDFCPDCHLGGRCACT